METRKREKLALKHPMPGPAKEAGFPAPGQLEAFNFNVVREAADGQWMQGPRSTVLRGVPSWQPSSAFR